jgi:hypothetical protein
MNAFEAPVKLVEPERHLRANPNPGLAGGGTGHDASTPAGQLGVAFKRMMVAVRKLRGRETQRPGQISYARSAMPSRGYWWDLRRAPSSLSANSESARI